MKRLIKITERDITNIVNRIIKEMEDKEPNKGKMSDEELKKMLKASAKRYMSSPKFKENVAELQAKIENELNKKKNLKENDSNVNIQKVKSNFKKRLEAKFSEKADAIYNKVDQNLPLIFMSIGGANLLATMLIDFYSNMIKNAQVPSSDTAEGIFLSFVPMIIGAVADNLKNK